jgi:uncharacterized protein (TIGR03435 family)
VSDPDKLKTITSKKARSRSNLDWAKGTSTIEDKPVSGLADALEGWFLHAPVLDQSGILGRYDFTLHWNVHDKSTRTEMIVNELHLVGLELISTNLPVEMLVVESVK